MKHFTLVHTGLDVAPLLAELAAAPELWDAHRERTVSPGGYMHGTSDIWLRYFPRASLKTAADYLGEGRCEFYPSWHALPSLHAVAHGLMSMCRGVELGTCLISRIPPGGEVAPHRDGACWSARYYQRKFYCILAANPACLNVTEDEEVVLKPGEIWEFDNLHTHAVYNRGETDRINLIITLRSADA